MTGKACAEAVMAEESAYLAALEQVPAALSATTAKLKLVDGGQLGAPRVLARDPLRDGPVGSEWLGRPGRDQDRPQEHQVDADPDREPAMEAETQQGERSAGADRDQRRPAAGG